jgi:diadenosine tetraphosphate (Ap4A) HIT family hydrolase
MVSGEIAVDKIYEDDWTLAFLSIAPINHGHTLVIPKDHFENIYSTPDETMARMALTVKKLAVAVKNALDADGINVGQNNEEVAGQAVFHSHVHIIPRFTNDGLEQWHGKAYLAGEAEEFVKKIKFAISN